MIHLKEVVITFVTILLISSNVNAESKYGENIEGEILYATVLKTGDSYSITNISPTEGNVRINDLSPNFSLKERRCGVYYANGSPADEQARTCEKDKAYNFLNIKVNKVENVLFTAFTLGTNIVGGGRHWRNGYFDEDEYKKAIDESIIKTSVDRKTLIANYTYFKNKDKELLDSYNNQKNNLKIMFKVNDETGFYNNIDLTEYVVGGIERLFLMNVKSQPFKDFCEIVDRKSVDSLLSQKYNKYTFNGFTGTIMNFNVNLEPATADCRDNSVMMVKANIISKRFDSVYPNYNNEDKNIKITFDDNKLQFENKTGNYLQILSVSMYYGSYCVFR